MGNVLKSERKESSKSFLQTVTELREVTIHNTARFPKRWETRITNNILKLARDIYTYTFKANAIYLCKTTPEYRYTLREQYLTVAVADLDTLGHELTFCHGLVDKGNNFFENRFDYNKMFRRWVALQVEAYNKVRAIQDSDTTRWNSWNKSSG